MYVYRVDQDALYLAIALQDLKVFLLKQGFTHDFLESLGIFLLPRRADKQMEGRLIADAPVPNLVFLYYDDMTMRQLNGSLFRVIRSLALRVAHISGKNTFPGSLMIDDAQQDIEHFSALASSFSFVSFSEQLQPQEEADTALRFPRKMVK